MFAHSGSPAAGVRECSAWTWTALFHTWIRVGEQRANGEEHLGDGQCRAPIVLKDVQANGAVAVDVAVINSGAANHLAAW